MAQDLSKSKGQPSGYAKPCPSRWQMRHDTLLAILMVLPAMLLVAGIYVYPAVMTVVLSFADFDLVRLGIRRFVGFRNYADLLASPGFIAVAFRTIYFGMVIVVLTTILAFLIALLLNQDFWGRTLLRVAVVLPWAVPPVVSGVLWGQMFHAEMGFVNALLYRLGLIDQYQIWLGNPISALHVIVIAEVWKALPFMVLFLLAGLQSMPKDVFEAAAIDGASAWQRFTQVMLPLMLPIMIPLMVIQFVWAMKAFDSIFVLTRGGPGGATTTLNYFVYQEGFQFFDLGRASAAAYILLLITLAVMGIILGMRWLLVRRGLINA
jgi:multiple sugar transport system permease protein